MWYRCWPNGFLKLRVYIFETHCRSGVHRNRAITLTSFTVQRAACCLPMNVTGHHRTACFYLWWSSRAGVHLIKSNYWWTSHWLPTLIVKSKKGFFFSDQEWYRFFLHWRCCSERRNVWKSTVIIPIFVNHTYHSWSKSESFFSSPYQSDHLGRFYQEYITPQCVQRRSSSA